jgi:hypothetical protein
MLVCRLNDVLNLEMQTMPVACEHWAVADGLDLAKMFHFALKSLQKSVHACTKIKESIHFNTCTSFT